MCVWIFINYSNVRFCAPITICLLIESFTLISDELREIPSPSLFCVCVTTKTKGFFCLFVCFMERREPKNESFALIQINDLLQE